MMMFSDILVSSNEIILPVLPSTWVNLHRHFRQKNGGIPPNYTNAKFAYSHNLYVI
jgi:hypothetical protein